MKVKIVCLDGSKLEIDAKNDSTALDIKESVAKELNLKKEKILMFRKGQKLNDSCEIKDEWFENDGSIAVLEEDKICLSEKDTAKIDNDPFSRERKGFIHYGMCSEDIIKSQETPFKNNLLYYEQNQNYNDNKKIEDINTIMEVTNISKKEAIAIYRKNEMDLQRSINSIFQ